MRRLTALHQDAVDNHPMPVLGGVKDRFIIETTHRNVASWERDSQARPKSAQRSTRSKSVVRHDKQETAKFNKIILMSTFKVCVNLFGGCESENCMCKQYMHNSDLSRSV